MKDNLNENEKLLVASVKTNWELSKTQTFLSELSTNHTCHKSDI